MTPANTTTATNVFAGTLLNDHHYRVLNGVVVPVPYPEACELLEYST